VSNIDIPSPLGNNALILASAAGKYDVVKLLIDNKIDIDAQNLDGLTALHAASICGRLAVVRLLLESGCKTSLLDHRKRTAFRCAKDFQHAELVELFAAWKKTSDSRERLNEIQAQDVQDKQSSK
jgi:ankyrin repeat protein